MSNYCLEIMTKYLSLPLQKKKYQYETCASVLGFSDHEVWLLRWRLLLDVWLALAKRGGKLTSYPQCLPFLSARSTRALIFLLTVHFWRLKKLFYTNVLHCRLDLPQRTKMLNFIHLVEKKLRISVQIWLFIWRMCWIISK